MSKVTDAPRQQRGKHRRKFQLPAQQKPLTVAWLVRAATGDLTIEERAARRRKMRDIAVAFVVTAAIVLGLGAIGIARSPAASADPRVGCETIRWGFLGSQRRTICDAPRTADGWLRGREIWVPAGYVPGYTYCGTYSCSSSGGYYRERGTVALETYWVTDATVLPDEPGWLPTGSVVIR